MKNSFKILILLIITISLFNCSKSEDNPTSNTNQFIGSWEVLSGDFLFGNEKYVYFNSDNTANILRQTDDDFKTTYDTNYNFANGEIVIDGTGGQGSPGTFTYTFSDNILTLTSNSFSKVLQKADDAPTRSEWVTELNVVSQGNAPWEGEVDIAFTYDKSTIVYGKTNDSDHIGLIDPNTFQEIGQIETTYSAKAVEIEKVNADWRYVFQSDNGSALFYGVNQGSNVTELTSIETGAWITGLASINNAEIWIASNNESELYRYNYDGTNTIDETISLNIQPQGLDYQDGFLYICDGKAFHKCQVSPTFEVIESYQIDNTNISGIAFDDNHFWISGYNYDTNEYVIIETNLTI